MNNIVNYMFGGFSSAEYNEVIYIGIVLSIGMIILLSLVSKLKYYSLVIYELSHWGLMCVV